LCTYFSITYSTFLSEYVSWTPKGESRELQRVNKKLVSLLLDTFGNFCRKDQAYILYPVSNPRFKHLLGSKNLIFYTAYVDGISIV
jgi:hypothetical protein